MSLFRVRKTKPPEEWVTVPGSHSQEKAEAGSGLLHSLPWGTVGPQANLDHSSPWVTCWAGQDSSGFLAQGEKQLTECVTRARNSTTS